MEGKKGLGKDSFTREEKQNRAGQGKRPLIKESGVPPETVLLGPLYCQNWYTVSLSLNYNLAIRAV